MSNLPKYTASYDEKKEDWPVTNDATGKVLRRFDTKEELTAGGVLRDALGSQGGSVKIQKVNGRFDEERTYPRSKDPGSSKG
jgi:hypothetical protein